MESQNKVLQLSFLPWLTFLLILLNVAAFLIPGLFDLRAFESLSKSSFLISWGANVSSLTFAGEYWRLLSSQFLHLGFMHLTMNMVALWSIGAVLERHIPRPVFLIIYLFSGVTGALLSAVSHTSELVVSVGASAAILGLVGACIAHAVITRDKQIRIKELLLSLVLTFGAGLFLPLDNMAHLGGLLFGFVSGLLIGLVWHVWRPGRALVALSVTALAATSLAGSAMVYSHYAIPGGQGQVLAGEVLQILKHSGFGNDSEELTGLHQLNECIEQEFAAITPDFKACNVKKNIYDVVPEMLKTALLNNFERCIPLIAKLKNHYPETADQQKIMVVENYCTIHQQLYRTVFGDDATAAVDIAKVHDVAAKMKELADDIPLLNTPEMRFDWFYASRNSSEREDEYTVSKGVFKDITPPIKKVVEKAQCPYYYCNKK